MIRGNCGKSVILNPNRDYKSLWKASIKKVIQSLKKKTQPKRLSKLSLLDLEDLLDRKKKLKFIIYPNSDLRKSWDLLIGLIMIFMVITSPLLISFIDSSDFDKWLIIDLLITLIFIIDIFVNLNTAFYDEDGSLTTSRIDIFKSYLKTWLIIDLFTCIPFNLIQTLDGNSSLNKISNFRTLPKIFRIFRLIKIIKHVKSSNFIIQIQVLLGFSHLYMRLLLIFSAVLTSIHIIACIWYSSAKSNSFHSETWVVRFNIQDSDLEYAYLCSVYWAVTTLISVGYGDITPWTTEEISITLCWMVFSIYSLSFTISSLSSIISQIQQKNKLTDYLLVKTDNFIEEVSIPKDLVSKIKKYLKTSPGKYIGKSDEKKELLELFSFDLKLEIVQNSHGGAYRNFPVLAKQSTEFLVTILPLMTTQEYNIHEEVYAAGASADEIFFLLKGKVNFLHENVLFKVETFGGYFGDYEVFKRVAREYTARTAENSLLWIMNRYLIDIIHNDFHLVYKEFVNCSMKNFKKTKASLAEIECFREMKGSSTIQLRKSVSERYQTLLKDAANQNYKLNFNSISFEYEIDELVELLRYDSKILKNVKSKLTDALRLAVLKKSVIQNPGKKTEKI